MVIADSLEEFADKMAEQGVYKQQLLNTINEYNNAIESGNPEELTPPRVNGHYPISTPPFYAVPTTGQIYCNYGGVVINEKTQALDMQRKPIPGLYAVPFTAGGIFNSVYMGAIGIAGTFGYLAGKEA